MTKNRSLVIFGLGDVSELARHYFESDSRYKIVAYTVDREFCKTDTIDGLPLVAFDEIVASYPPAENDIFIAIGYSELNALRKRKFEEARGFGYRAASYISSRATVLNGGAIGANCFILEDNTIQPFVTIGDNVIMWSGNHIGHHSSIGAHCFISSHVVVSGRTTIGERCFIGVNSTIRDHVTVGECCILGAGTLLLSDAEPNGVYSPEATPRSRVPSNRLRKI